MAANRRKTIEYAFATRLTPLATNTTLATAARYDTASLTLTIPEITSRAFLSVRLVATYRTEYAVTNGITGWRMGIKLGAAAASDTDRTFTAQNTANRNLFDVVDLDVTSYFNASFGTGTSQTCVASLAVATTTATNINGITFKLVITYEFDPAAQPTRIKTIRIPIQSQTGPLTAAQQEIGTDSTAPAPANQIPALDTFLPEAGKVYRQIFLESAANDVNTAGNTAFRPFLQIDAATEVGRATIDETLATGLVWRDVLDLTGAMTTNAPHALKMRCDLAGRMTFAHSTLVVTYEYNAATTSSIMCEAIVPLTMSNDDSFGLAQGESFSTNVAGDAQALIAALSIQEANPVIAQSAVYLNVMSYSTGGPVNVRAAAQPYRPYNPGTVAVADMPVVHRVDHSSGWTVARGDNRLVLNLFNAVTVRCDVTGYALINYTAAAPADVDTATHAVNYFIAAYSNSSGPVLDIPASGGGQRAPVLGTPYRIQGAMIEQYYHASSNALFNQLLLEQRSGEWDGAGFITTPYRHGGIAQVGSWRTVWALTRACNLDHFHTGKLNVETARRQVAWCNGSTGQASWSWWITYHQLSFAVAGAVTIGGAPVGNGKTVEIYARDNRNNAEYVTSTTTGSGSGSFAVAVVDNTRTYFASYQDGSARGRSSDATPGASSFDVAIPAGITAATTSAGDVTARILSGGAIEVSWSFPGDFAAQGVVFDVYQTDDPTDAVRTLCAAAVSALVVDLPAANLGGNRYFSVVARRGAALALPSRSAFLAVPLPPPPPAPRSTGSPARPGSSGVGFPFGITPTGGVFVQGGDALLRGKILQLLLTSPGERVNRPDYGTRLLDLVFDPNSEVLAATMEFTITRALQQAFADEIQLDAVQLTTDDNTLLVDISYMRKADLSLDQLRVGLPLPAGGSP
ncbi:MAG TPA: GPW/gp25 family protein [Kofleriaceae bacterium]|nr:GPW/gp25 family protein [Kofleriaceae bacterium]